MDVWGTLKGYVRVEITGADIPALLTLLGQQNLELSNLVFVDQLTIQATIQRTCYRQCKAIVLQRGEKIKILQLHGTYWKIQKLFCRPVLLTGILFFLALMLGIPSRIFFVRVEGNQTVPERLIIEQAELCGIFFGASRREVRSERVKNELLSKIPELQWVGVNTSGCVATIVVREKNLVSVDITPQKLVSSIVASRDGIIKQCTVYKGNVLCKIGQAVTAGEVLVSGYTDCGISIRATQADAEIFAQTLRELEVISPNKFTVRSEAVDRKVRYSLIVGKKLIKFFKDSGISDTTCVKMYTEKVLSLPGGFQLPVTLISEELTYYNSSTVEFKENSIFVWMENFAERYLNTQMVSGEIVESDFDIKSNQETVTLHGQYICSEMIGQVKGEEIMKPNGKND